MSIWNSIINCLSSICIFLEALTTFRLKKCVYFLLSNFAIHLKPFSISLWKMTPLSRMVNSYENCGISALFNATSSLGSHSRRRRFIFYIFFHPGALENAILIRHFGPGILHNIPFAFALVSPAFFHTHTLFSGGFPIPIFPFSLAFSHTSNIFMCTLRNFANMLKLFIDTKK